MSVSSNAGEVGGRPATSPFVERILSTMQRLGMLELGDFTTDLCRQCKKFTQKTLLETLIHFSESTDQPTLTKTAQSCALCKMILTNILKKPLSIIEYQASGSDSFSSLSEAEKLLYEGDEHRYPYTINIFITPKAITIHLRSKLTGRDMRVIRSNLDITTDFESVEEQQRYFPASLTTARPNWARNLWLLREWLHDCSEHHKDCPRLPINSKLPARVIDVRGKPKLFDSRGLSGRYMTLSYRWGKFRPLITTRANFRQFYKGINETLPVSFEDAIHITRHLGVDFLWIDSLCIVQDDEADWLEEASKMGSIFANSYCTIAATEGKDNSHGILKTDTGMPRVKVLLGNTPGSYGYLGFRPDPFQDIDLAGLNERGWVLQERLLSPRIVHFTKFRMYWECRLSIGCDDLTVVSRTTGLLNLTRERPGDHGIHISTPEQWFEIVQKYSQCLLTRATDKLHAINGIVSSIGTHTGHRFLNGIWEDAIIQGVLWCHKETHFERFTALKLPSWSWMAYTGPMQHVQLGFHISKDPEWDITCSSTNDETLYAYLIRFVDGARLGASVDGVPCNEINHRCRYSVVLDSSSSEIGWFVFDLDHHTQTKDALTDWGLVQMTSGGIYVLGLQKVYNRKGDEAYLRTGVGFIRTRSPPKISKTRRVVE